MEKSHFFITFAASITNIHIKKVFYPLIMII